MLRRPETRKGLNSGLTQLGETGSDGEECGAAFSKTAGCRFDSCPTCPSKILNSSGLQTISLQPNAFFLGHFILVAAKTAAM